MAHYQPTVQNRNEVEVWAKRCEYCCLTAACMAARDIGSVSVQVCPISHCEDWPELGDLERVQAKVAKKAKEVQLRMDHCSAAWYLRERSRRAGLGEQKAQVYKAEAAVAGIEVIACEHCRKDPTLASRRAPAPVHRSQNRLARSRVVYRVVMVQVGHSVADDSPYALVAHSIGSQAYNTACWVAASTAVACHWHMVPRMTRV